MSEGFILPYNNHRMRDPKCEFMEPGTVIVERPACRERATRRHVDDNGKTLGLFCDDHNHPGPGVAEVEYVPSRNSGLIF